MKVKGTILLSIQGYISENFPNRYQEWEEALPPNSKKLYQNTILPSEWYDYQSGLIKPSETACQLFFGNDIKKSAWEFGRYSAEIGLKGIYKVFVLIATPKFIMKRSGKILASFYKPATLQTDNERQKGVTIHITSFEDPTEIAEYRIAGWMEKALEICGVKNISIKIEESMLTGAERTVYVLDWD